jgi:hypothetical protein
MSEIEALGSPHVMLAARRATQGLCVSLLWLAKIPPQQLVDFSRDGITWAAQILPLVMVFALAIPKPTH